MLVGLTGGIASGKSLIADMFADLGVPVVDTDIIARQVVAPGMPALDEIRDKFGPDVMQTDGTLDRRAMRDIIFADDVKRRELEAILHPKIRDEAERQVAGADHDYVIVVVPLLVGSPMQEMMDRILVVDCDEETQVARLVARDVESVAQARRIMATQSSRSERLAIADDVIENNGTIEAAHRLVAALHSNYLKQAVDNEF